MEKIGFGGSCHWCTEAIFESLKGVVKVEQGWIASVGDAASLSEAVIVHFDPPIISLDILIAIHLHTHSCTSSHNKRYKYRSAIYVFTPQQIPMANKVICLLQSQFDRPIITRVLPFKQFEANEANYLNYYYSNPQKPFCRNVINPKLRQLLAKFAKQVDKAKLPLPNKPN
jgi:peptide-methionine (S)-S-oxide reductase